MLKVFIKKKKKRKAFDKHQEDQLNLSKTF